MHSGNVWLEPTRSQPEIDCAHRLLTRDGSRLEMDRGLIWIMTTYGWMTRDGSQGMDHWRRMATLPVPFYEDIEFMRSYMNLEITTLISNYEVTLEHRYGDIRCTGGIAPVSTIPSTTQSIIQRCRFTQLYARLTMPSMIPDEIPTQPQ
jgi:hypothetical protein